MIDAQRPRTRCAGANRRGQGFIDQTEGHRLVQAQPRQDVADERFNALAQAARALVTGTDRSSGI